MLDSLGQKSRGTKEKANDKADGLRRVVSVVTQTSNLGTAVGTKNVRRPKGYAPLPAYEGKSTESASLHCCRGHAFRDRAQGAQRRLRDFYHALLAIIIHIFRSKADPGLGGRFRRLQQTIDVLEGSGDLPNLRSQFVTSSTRTPLSRVGT